MMRSSTDLGLRVKWFAIVMGVLAVGCTVLSAMFWESLDPWEVGVMHVKFASSKTYYDGYKGGHTYVQLPFRNELIHVPVNLKYLAIHADRTPDGKIIEGTGLVVPTSDGQKVTTDISIVYRVMPEANLPAEAEKMEEVEAGVVEEIQKAADVVDVEAEAKKEKDLATMALEVQEIGYHGGPLQLITQAGTNEMNWAQKVQQIAEDGCKRAFSKMTTDDFYNSQKRETMAYMAQRMLNEGWIDDQGAVYTGLHAYGVHIEGVLVRAYTFPGVINDAIFAKVTQVQQASLNEAKEELERQTALVTKVDAEGKANKEVKETEAEAQVTIIGAEADLYDKSKRAEGDLLVATAKAAVTEMKSKVFDMPGGDLYVARELKDLPTKVEGGILTDFNPLEISAWMEMISSKAEPSVSVESPAPVPPVPAPPVALPAPPVPDQPPASVQ